MYEYLPESKDWFADNEVDQLTLRDLRAKLQDKIDALLVITKEYKGIAGAAHLRLEDNFPPHPELTDGFADLSDEDVKEEYRKYEEIGKDAETVESIFTWMETLTNVLED
jgi:hypothetical protein